MEPLTETRTFDAQMTVSEALQLHPSARWVFAAYRLSGCTQCESSPEETLAEVAEGYRFELADFLRDLNSLFHR
jgi:hypothetical protein